MIHSFPINRHGATGNIIDFSWLIKMRPVTFSFGAERKYQRIKKHSLLPTKSWFYPHKEFWVWQEDNRIPLLGIASNVTKNPALR